MRNQACFERKFNLILRRALEEGFESISDTLSPVIYYLLRQKYGFKEGNEHLHAAELSAYIKELFGEEGQKIIEKILTQKIASKIGIYGEELDFMLRLEFAERVKYAKQKYIQQKKKF